MAYYAALVSLVELLKEMSHPIPDHRYPKSLFQKQRINGLYEKFSRLQVLLDDYSPKDKEADGFLERIRDVACRVELIIEGKTSDAALRECGMPYAACGAHRMPDVAYEAKRIMSQISDQIREPNCLAEIIRLLCFTIFVSAYHNSEPVNEEAVENMRKGYRELSKLTDVLEYGFEIGYGDLEKLKREADSVLGKGYLDVVKLEEEIDSIAIKGYQDLVKLKEDIDYIVIQRYQGSERVEEVFRSMVLSRYHDLVRVKEEVNSVVGKGYDDLMEKVLKQKVGPIAEELMLRIKDSHTIHPEDFQVTVGGPSNDGTTMVVLDENRITPIKDQILGDSSKLEVISIEGMGGIGKTTLARHIFDDENIQNHFDFCVWVTVSQSYHLPEILRDIAKSLNIIKEDLSELAKDVVKDSPNTNKEDLNKEGSSEVRKDVSKDSQNISEEDLDEERFRVGVDVSKNRIYKHLYGCRYLIILDDVWDTKVWDELRWIFPNDNNSKGRIILTTRQSDVADLAKESDFIYKIPILTHDQSWTLFSEKVQCPLELEDIGRSIVKNCGGLPLAIVVVAGLLSKVNTTRSDWKEVARGLSSTSTAIDEHFSKILSLSYNYLPHYLKPCFLYLGGFPEDYEISVSRLIKLWVAEGFLKPVASKSLEEAGEEYLEELVKRNLILITKQRSNGKFKSCIMHDLLRDLCIERAHQEHFLLLPHKHNATDHTHRFFIHLCSPDIDFRKDNVHHIRSIVSVGRTYHDFKSHPSSFNPLRVLSAPYSFSFLFELLNLRYLTLQNFEISSSISQLQHLQTLTVWSDFSSLTLPAKIWEMPRLRHVMANKLKLPPCSGGGTNNSDGLPSLQTLSTLEDFTFTSRIVEMIPSVRKLKLEYVEKSELPENVWSKFGLKHLIRLHQLETLAVNVVIGVNYIMPFPESFAFPSNLRKLTLKGCRLPWSNMTVVGTLLHLQVLKLREYSFVGEEWESEGEFSELKFLEISKLFVKNWQTESSHFPSLEHLVIKYCRNLEGISSEIGEFPKLKLIELRSCNSRVKESAREIQEELLNIGNPTLQVRVYD